MQSPNRGGDRGCVPWGSLPPRPVQHGALTCEPLRFPLARAGGRRRGAGAAQGAAGRAVAREPAAEAGGGHPERAHAGRRPEMLASSALLGGLVSAGISLYAPAGAAWCVLELHLARLALQRHSHQEGQDAPSVGYSTERAGTQAYCDAKALCAVLAPRRRSWAPRRRRCSSCGRCWRGTSRRCGGAGRPWGKLQKMQGAAFIRSFWGGTWPYQGRLAAGAGCAFLAGRAGEWGVLRAADNAVWCSRGAILILLRERRECSHPSTAAGARAGGAELLAGAAPQAGHGQPRPAAQRPQPQQPRRVLRGPALARRPRAWRLEACAAAGQRDGSDACSHASCCLLSSHGVAAPEPCIGLRVPLTISPCIINLCHCSAQGSASRFL